MGRGSERHIDRSRIGRGGGRGAEGGYRLRRGCSRSSRGGRVEGSFLEEMISLDQGNGCR